MKAKKSSKSSKGLKKGKKLEHTRTLDTGKVGLSPFSIKQTTDASSPTLYTK